MENDGEIGACSTYITGWPGIAKPPELDLDFKMALHSNTFTLYCVGERDFFSPLLDNVEGKMRTACLTDHTAAGARGSRLNLSITKVKSRWIY